MGIQMRVAKEQNINILNWTCCKSSSSFLFILDHDCELSNNLLRNINSYGCGMMWISKLPRDNSLQKAMMSVIVDVIEPIRLSTRSDWSPLELSNH